MNRKTITLPSGATCMIRPLSPYDYLEFGKIPIISAEMVSEIKKARKKQAPDKPVIEPEAMQSGIINAKLSLTKACGKLKYPDGVTVKVVDKPFDECAFGEIAIEELSQQDAECIVKEVAELTKSTKEAALKAQPFPEKQESTPGG